MVLPFKENLFLQSATIIIFYKMELIFFVVFEFFASTWSGVE